MLFHSPPLWSESQPSSACHKIAKLLWGLRGTEFSLPWGHAPSRLCHAIIKDQLGNRVPACQSGNAWNMKSKSHIRVLSAVSQEDKLGFGKWGNQSVYIRNTTPWLHFILWFSLKRRAATAKYAICATFAVLFELFAVTNLSFRLFYFKSLLLA